MSSRPAIARDAAQTADERTDGQSVHEQSQSVARALNGLAGGDTLDDDIQSDQFEQLETSS